MPFFFWPGVAFFYLGLFVLAYDLTLEHLTWKWRSALWAAELLIAFAVLQTVVLRDSPIDVSYRITDTGLIDLFVKNESSSDDYHDLDITLTSDSSGSFFDKTRNVSSFPAITIVERGWKLISDGKDYSMARPTIRLWCPLLPKNSTADMLLSLVTGTPSGVAPSTNWNDLTVSGEFKGKFRTVNISKKAVRYDQ